MDKGKRSVFAISFADETRKEAFHTVIAYEAAVRGLTMSQVLREMVMKGAAAEGLPDELHQKLDESRRRRAHDAAIEALADVVSERSA